MASEESPAREAIHWQSQPSEQVAGQSTNSCKPHTQKASLTHTLSPALSTTVSQDKEHHCFHSLKTIFLKTIKCNPGHSRHGRQQAR
ncbi:rCG50977 [Rattus norvegicus]|uniref:RCG50977 n=1 Tax=Rattus norvegicus TaxID=10116 RepID=A6KGI4_RAT|nr:rCG50977 [Rattus norvegicus]